jgi:hypothetical protein
MAPRTGRMFDLDSESAQEDEPNPESGLSARKIRIIFRTFNRSQAVSMFGGSR